MKETGPTFADAECLASLIDPIGAIALHGIVPSRPCPEGLHPTMHAQRLYKQELKQRRAEPSRGFTVGRGTPEPVGRQWPLGTAGPL